MLTRVDRPQARVVGPRRQIVGSLEPPFIVVIAFDLEPKVRAGDDGSDLAILGRRPRGWRRLGGAAATRVKTALAGSHCRMLCDITVTISFLDRNTSGLWLDALRQVQSPSSMLAYSSGRWIKRRLSGEQSAGIPIWESAIWPACFSPASVGLIPAKEGTPE